MRRAALVLLLSLGVGASCASRTDARGSAAHAGQEFYRAFAAQDGAAACAVLAPGTVHELEKSASAPCAQAVLDEELPEPGAIESTAVFGSEARVGFAADTVFVTDFQGAWKIVAAGCTERGELPYDCQIQGG